ncbi:MAG: flavodoxin family protein [Bacillota bacterium]
MNIGIVVYSHTGNTYSVVEKFKKELEEMGNVVSIERLEPVNKEDVQPRAKNIEYKRLPELDKYDAYIFASPIQAFSLCTGMKSFLEKMESLNNKEVACFVTKGLPFNWTGGNRAIRQFKKLLKQKDAKIVETGIIKWTKNKEKDIDKVINKLTSKF